jgi:L-2-hydroxyglutarate oxidase LhgO
VPPSEPCCTELQPDWKIVVLERLSEVAEESSNAWNNAGTGTRRCAS